jgi:C-terminal processing protease CtpA/Prc
MENASENKEANKPPAELTLNGDLFQSYIYKHPLGANIGFLRIPTYHKIKSENLEDLEALIIYLNKQTDALVIDQQNNSGGYHHHVCTIASMLTDRPLITPLERLKLTHQIVGETYKNSKKAQALLSTLEFFGLFELLEINYQEHLFLTSYLDFIMEEWNAGRTLTNPTHIGTIDYIHPHPTARYTKPILFLINELDFSSADFMPAILQDSKRAYLFGERTAGAGGAVETLSFPNSNGIRFFSCTTTIGERVGDRKIENLGVEPDFHYQLTVEDVRDGYKDYINAVNATLETILPLKTPLPIDQKK